MSIYVQLGLHMSKPAGTCPLGVDMSGPAGEVGESEKTKAYRRPSSVIRRDRPLRDTSRASAMAFRSPP